MHLISVCWHWLFNFSHLFHEGRLISRRISTLHWLFSLTNAGRKNNHLPLSKIKLLFPNKSPVLMLLRNVSENGLWFWVSPSCTVTELNMILSQSCSFLQLSHVSSVLVVHIYFPSLTVLLLNKLFLWIMQDGAVKGAPARGRGLELDVL